VPNYTGKRGALTKSQPQSNPTKKEDSSSPFRRKKFPHEYVIKEKENQKKILLSRHV